MLVEEEFATGSDSCLFPLAKSYAIISFAIYTYCVEIDALWLSLSVSDSPRMMPLVFFP